MKTLFNKTFTLLASVFLTGGFLLPLDVKSQEASVEAARAALVQLAELNKKQALQAKAAQKLFEGELQDLKASSLGSLTDAAPDKVLLTAEAQEKKQIRISAIQAKLFYNNTGTLSENVLTEKGADLWNSPFDATYSTLVLVELDGLPEYLESNIRIELTARYIPFEREKGSIIVRQFETIRNGSETGRAYAGFWLKRTGCNPVYLTARIVGRRQQQRRVKEKINFGCGE